MSKLRSFQTNPGSRCVRDTMAGQNLRDHQLRIASPCSLLFAAGPHCDSICDEPEGPFLATNRVFYYGCRDFGGRRHLWCTSRRLARFIARNCIRRTDSCEINMIHNKLLSLFQLAK